MKNKIHIEKLSADRFTPLVVFKKLNGLALLESAVLEIGKSRYSIIMVEEAFSLVLEENGIYISENKKKTVLSNKPEEYLTYLKTYQDKLTIKKQYPIPIPAKGIGYLSYDTVKYFDDIRHLKQTDTLKLPEAIFMFGSCFVIFDHYKDELNIVTVNHSNKKINLEKKAKIIKQRLLDNDFRAYETDEKKYKCSVNLSKNKSTFINGVKKIKKEVTKGNLLQCVLSRRIDIKSNIKPLEVYRRLRRENPSPYLFYLNFGNFDLFGSSPEIMVQLDKGVSVLKPIAGTRPRGKTHQEDLDLEKDLLADEKERAEHLMLIDLARNDLGRTAKPGSVNVTEKYNIERYSHVMHIVSRVEAQIEKKKTINDLITTTFPAGTVSGAPKIQAIETLYTLEKEKRGPYAGLIGYFDVNNDFDSCITIRSVIHKDRNYYIQAGAGIVYDSVPEKEYQETINKAKAMLKAMGISIK